MATKTGESDRGFQRKDKPGQQTHTPGAEAPSAKSIITQWLRSWGLESLGDWAWRRYLALGGGDLANQQIQLEITDRPEFQARFPAYKDLVNSGHAMSVAEMLSYEQTAVGLMRAVGIPSGFYDQPDDLAKFMRNQVSVAELQQRVLNAASAADAPSETKDALQRLYGIGQGALTAYFLDPDKAQNVLTKQFQAGQLAGIASRTGFGQVDVAQAERLQSLGVSEDQAQQGFGQLVAQRGALAPQVGEQAITDQQQLEAVFEGNQLAQQRIKRRQAARANEFGGGGGFGAGSQGVTGLGGRQ